jgi:molybdopterin-containing oxidoreductase family membrane subunit
MITSCFFLGLEFFTAFYSGIPGHMNPFIYLYAGLEGHHQLVPLMWFSTILALIAVGILVFPFLRRNETILAFASAAVFLSLWIDKGFGLIVGGFVPNPFERITEYWPTTPEFLIALGVWGIGFLILTVLYKIAVSIKEESGGEAIH